MLAHDRHQYILETLKRENSVRTQALVRHFGVSLETVRRDLEGMEAAGLLRRVHGGAVLDRIDAGVSDFASRIDLNVPQKHAIGHLLCRYLREGQSVALDAGTTTLEAARVLRQSFQRLTVLSNALDIHNVLADAPGFTLISPGGCFNPVERTFVGEIAEQSVADFHVDTAVLTVSGVSLREGLTDFGFGEVSFKKKLIRSAQQVIVLADSGKFDCVSLMKVCGLSEVDVLITDDGISPHTLQRFTEEGFEVICK